MVFLWFSYGFPHFVAKENPSTCSKSMPRRQLDETRSRLVFRGNFQKDLRVGLAEVYDDYGGCSWVAHTRWDKDGLSLC